VKGLFPSSGFLLAVPCLFLVFSAWMFLQGRIQSAKTGSRDGNEVLLIGGLLAAIVSLLLFLGYLAVGTP
jgi:hypothetical protein